MGEFWSLLREAAEVRCSVGDTDEEDTWALLLSLIGPSSCLDLQRASSNYMECPGYSLLGLYCWTSWRPNCLWEGIEPQEAEKLVISFWLWNSRKPPLLGNRKD